MNEELKYFELHKDGLDSKVIIACKPEQVEDMRSKFKDCEHQPCTVHYAQSVLRPCRARCSQYYLRWTKLCQVRQPLPSQRLVQSAFPQYGQLLSFQI